MTSAQDSYEIQSDEEACGSITLTEDEKKDLGAATQATTLQQRRAECAQSSTATNAEFDSWTQRWLGGANAVTVGLMIFSISKLLYWQNFYNKSCMWWSFGLITGAGLVFMISEFALNPSGENNESDSSTPSSTTSPTGGAQQSIDAQKQAFYKLAAAEQSLGDALRNKAIVNIVVGLLFLAGAIIASGESWAAGVSGATAGTCILVDANPDPKYLDDKFLLYSKLEDTREKLKQEIFHLRHLKYVESAYNLTSYLTLIKTAPNKLSSPSIEDYEKYQNELSEFNLVQFDDNLLDTTILLKK